MRRALLLAMALAAAGVSAAPIEFTQAQFLRTDVAQAAEQPVELPDTWARRALEGAGRYRVEFTLAQVPQGLWGLRADRLSAVHTVRVNGEVVADHRPAAELSSTARSRPMPEFVALPPSLLRAGRNRIEIEVVDGLRGGLSSLQVGPAAEVKPLFERARWRSHTLPQLLNIAGAALSMFMLLVWSRRRAERAIGLFGALWLIASVRNYSYFATMSPPPWPLSDWLYYMAQAGTVMLLCAFALALAGGAWPRLRMTLRVCAIALPLLATAASFAGELGRLRTLSYPLLFVLSAAALRVLWTVVRRLPAPPIAALFAGMTLVVAAGVHDYLHLHGRISVLDLYWLPFVMPFALATFAWMLLNRLVHSMNEAEELSARLEVRVAERTRELQAANEAKSRFLAAASHDLRQPVVSIGLLVGLVRERIAAPELRRLIDKVDQAVASMEALLKGLLDLSRLESGTVRARLRPLSLQALFDAVAAHERATAAGRSLRLRLRPTSLWVRSDPLLLEQMLRNLVSNALRYTDRGGVLVSARRQAGGVSLQVWDTGHGIALEHRPRVFEEFVQLENPGRDSTRGLGLGLAIVKRSAQLLGHGLHLESRPGRGSCFALVLPEMPAHDEAPARPAAPASREPLAGQRVVVVEDDASVRLALRARLEAWGATVAACDGAAAFDRWLAADPPRPDLLVTDRRLPDGDGLRVIARLRARFGVALPVLLVTGDTAPADLARLREAAIPVLHKPFGAEALLGAIDAARGRD